MTGAIERSTLYGEFLAAWPAYERTCQLDVLRQTEYSRLDRLGHSYLDYTGAGLYATRQVREHVSLSEATHARRGAEPGAAG